MKDHYIGVDGGGTKTCIALFDSSNHCMDTLVTTGSNHENLDGGFNEAAATIFHGITTLLDKHQLTVSNLSSSVMGLAGVDHEYQRAALAERFEQFGLTNAVLFNDGFLPVLAGTDGAGIGYNTGTGSCAAAIDINGTRKQLGGIGDLSNDLGNGFWIIGKVFYSVYEELFLLDGRTLMTELYLKGFGIHSPQEFLDTIPLFHAAEASARHKVIQLFFEALAARDAKAVQIASLMAEQASKLIHAFIKTMDFPMNPIPVVLSGSIHTKAASPEYLALLQQTAQDRCGRALQFSLLAMEPVQGCRTYRMRYLNHSERKNINERN